MSIQQHYNQWSDSYDEMENKTRDLEKRAGMNMLATIGWNTVLELGCGTGKNTSWLREKAKKHLAIDLSEGMLEKARGKVTGDHVVFQQADITKPWRFAAEKVDLITCSLILEHIEDLEFIFSEAANVLKTNGHFYICELHPYKQYSGSKARFETEEGTQVLQCFVHHVSDYTHAAVKNGFSIETVEEWFDDDDRCNPPRLLSFLLRKV
ncbi:MAG TPA: class I SAM-dependent methyltransferase [Flavisolibacter sp.]